MASYHLTCHWMPVNHWLFQIANVFLALSFVAGKTMYGLVYLRFVLAMAGLSFSLWGWFILCALDTVIWNAAFFVFNIIHVIYLIILMRPVKFSHHHEIVYRHVFKPFGVKRYEYKSITAGGTFNILTSGEIFRKPLGSNEDTLSMLLEGSLIVSDGIKVLHSIKPLELLDSTDLVSETSVDAFHKEARILASEYSVYVTWDRTKLSSALKANERLRTAFEAIIREDLGRKLNDLYSLVYKLNAVINYDVRGVPWS